jgi:DNA repair protein RecO (recombination protein O)
MIETATGLVLRTYPLTETSLIVHWLTPAFGRLATVAKGARKAKSVFQGKLDLFFLADFSFSRSRRSELHTLREVTVRNTHRALRQDLVHLQQVAYCSAFIELTTETDTPLPDIFELLRGMLEHICSSEAQPQTVFAFEIKLLNELGLEPNLAGTNLTEGSKAVVRMLAQADWPVILSLRLSSSQQRELNQFLHGFIIYHLGRLPRGRAAAVPRPSQLHDHNRQQE